LRPEALEPRRERHKNVLIFTSDLNRLDPPGVDHRHPGIVDFFDLDSINRHQLQGRLEQLAAADKNRIRLTRPIFLQSDVEDGALGRREHQITFLNTDRQIFRRVFAGHP
jgi:hypothetical protein